MFRKICLVLCCMLMCTNIYADDFAEEVIVEESIEEKDADEISAEAISEYVVEGSLFEKITNLEQEKLLMKLEAERMKLEIELDNLNAQKMKKQMEIDSMYGQTDQKQDFQKTKDELDAKIESLKSQIAAINSRKNEQSEKDVEKTTSLSTAEQTYSIASKYKLINVVGVGNQLQATIQDISNGQNKRISVGKELDGYTIKSISLNDGIVFEKNGVSENLNVGK